MFPILAFPNAANNAAANSKLCRQLSSLERTGFDLQSLRFGELGVRVPASSQIAENLITMKLIISSCHPLKIADGVIRLISVFVVNLGEVLRIRQENFSDKAMNKKALHFPVSTEFYMDVAVAMVLRDEPSFFELPCHIAPATTNSRLSCHPKNASIAVDLVKAFVARDRFPHASI